MKQHSVPRFYLRQFTAVGGQQVLWEYRKGREQPKRRSAKSAAVRSHLYSVRRADGGWDESIEDQLQRVESAAAGPLKNLAEGAALAEEDREKVAFFIGLMFLRVLGYHEHAARQANRVRAVEATLKFLEERSIVARILPRELVDAYKQEVTRRGYGIELPPQHHLVHVFERAWKYAGVIGRMNWTVYRACRGRFFVTSDNPAFTRRSGHPLDPGLVGLNRRDLGAELGFPLSRGAFLVGHWAEAPSGVHTVDASKVRELNTRTVLSAHKYVFSPQRSSEIEALVRQCADFRVAYPEIAL